MYICRVVKNLDATVEKIKKTLPNVTDWDIQVTSNVTSHSLHYTCELLLHHVFVSRHTKSLVSP
jgi:uncharacterized protein YoxC